VRMAGTALAVALAACGVKAPPRPPLSAPEAAAPAPDGGRPGGEACPEPGCTGAREGADGGGKSGGGKP